MAEHKDIIAQIRAFDSRLGKDLEAQGYKSMSVLDHERLRVYLRDAGYEVAYSQTGCKALDYLLSERNVYTRLQDGIEVFVERNLQDWGNGFSYLKLNSVKEYNQFEQGYIRALDFPMSYLVSLTGGISGAIIGLAFALTESLLPGLALFSGSVMGGMVAPLVIDDQVTQEKKKLIAKLGKGRLVTNPRQAILNAFHVSQEVVIVPIEDGVEGGT